MEKLIMKLMMAGMAAVGLVLLSQCAAEDNLNPRYGTGWGDPPAGAPGGACVG